MIWVKINLPIPEWTMPVKCLHGLYITRLAFIRFDRPIQSILSLFRFLIKLK